ncbi:hypothetical protein GPUN_1084 [Glaciecola punicea ACAM 611]|uniref:Uncharacterized protein n=1 Tax=Glaciecola punicea ACAM 611 TaxID=1121923 RepID=H5TA88_9ALTE|nr:hypothetical protein GPUN_1084 [Glaciecola punicea ACAM 611]
MFPFIINAKKIKNNSPLFLSLDCLNKAAHSPSNATIHFALM